MQQVGRSERVSDPARETPGTKSDCRLEASVLVRRDSLDVLDAPGLTERDRFQIIDRITGDDPVVVVGEVCESTMPCLRPWSIRRSRSDSASDHSKRQ